MKIGVSEDGEAGDDRVVKGGAQGLRTVDLPASLILQLSEKTELMKIMDTENLN